ncbi:head GIN domain-containing protein [Altererythrobacter lutimaris]|uniref:DUF2807 domain-containing protein n=1 Tax=Altererythrobacter lutimaris TaxID=2743979 RepID=A0A850HCY2_9SPHN|nr:head GIN domain-containing protein [Altererythrobacter lutimaris]NVE95420.1 DUF2807 domain-containing protein [Altererythrobacter lutimaris]
MLHKMIKTFAPVAAIALSAALAGCGDFDMKINDSEGVPLAELDMSGPAPEELAVSGPDTIILTEGDTLTITIDGDAEDADQVRFHRDGKTLGVFRESGNWSKGSAVTVNITMPAPREIAIGGSGDVEASTMAREASIAIGGSGSVAVKQIDAESLEVVIGGSGSVAAAGTAESLEMSIGGNGNGDFAELKVDDAEINIGGSGNVSLQSDGKVVANIGGSGNVDVKGDATCTLNSFGSGSLTCTSTTETTTTEKEVAAKSKAAESKQAKPSKTKRVAKKSTSRKPRKA